MLCALGLSDGVTHIEFIGSGSRLNFLEGAARVAGANIDRLVEHASGINLWREWLKLELQGESYRPPRARGDSAVLMQCLARREWPDLSELDCPELAWTLKRAWHAGLVLASTEKEQVRRRAGECLARLEAEHLMVLPSPTT